jgi:hypothetical protein
MKSLTPLILVGALIALAGCTTDSPIFATEGTKEKQEGAGPSVQEQSRDAYIQQNNGVGLQGSSSTPQPTRSMMEQQAGNPYGH